jgi:integrator complex subunit 7
MHNLICCTLKFANTCHEVLYEAFGARYNPHDSMKGVMQFVHQDAPRNWSTYESFHLVMCACVTQNNCKISGGNQESGDSK